VKRSLSKLPDHLISELTGLSKLVTSPPQENVLAESRMMVPDCHKRLETALADLKATLVRHKSSVSVSLNVVHCFLRGPLQWLRRRRLN
jgi:hypothetical protein